ncbi:HtaA domain-containing protein [Microbacterium marinilacus]|uniref:Ig-like domain-containing protein n=1 Tax=Microbacterium marinilacus TaxID=415209 RepID=A0ABP7BTC3_9MICO|nr:HtaA domain-containing protein [Microbacterium marinilacus]MBY0688291.1 HtaA domain-containing protein [Microbacterium marinilacus]
MPVSSPRRRSSSRRSSSRALALLLGLVLAMSGAVVAGAPPATAAEEGVYDVTGGTFDWGFSKVYRDYVPGDIAHGEIIPGDGLIVNEDGTFRWTVTSGTFAPATGALDLALAGSVRFTGHSGVMDLTLSDLHVVADGYGSATVRADYRSFIDGEWLTGDDVALADLSARLGGAVTIDEGTGEWAGIGATLATGAGSAAPAFGSYASLIASLDPATWSIAGGWPAAQAEDWAEPGTATVAVETIDPPSGLTYASVAIDTARGLAFAGANKTRSNTPQIVVIDLETREQVQVIPASGTTTVRARGVIESTGEVLVVAGADFSLLVPQSDGSYAWGQTFAGAVGATYQPVIDQRTGDIVFPGGNGTVAVATRGEDGTYTVESSSDRVATDAVINEKSGLLYAIGSFNGVGAGKTSLYTREEGTLTLVRADQSDQSEVALAASARGDVYVASSGYDVGTFSAVPPRISIYRDDALTDQRIDIDTAAQRLAYDDAHDRLVAVTSGRSVRFYDAADPGAAPSLIASGAIDRAVASTTAVEIDDRGRLWIAGSSQMLVVSLQTTAAFTTDPADTTVVVPADADAATAELTAVVEGEDVGLQWQAKTPGDIAFRDVAGATTGTLAVTAGEDVDGTQYRVVATNPAGSVVSKTATLTVQTAPRVAEQPKATSVKESGTASFAVEVAGSPAPVVSWQVADGDAWVDLAAGDDVVIDGSTLTLKKVSVQRDGARYRAVLTSEAGVAYSDPAVLTVTAPAALPATETAYTGIELEWTGSGEMQAAPPFGGSNFFSAGESDGTEATYSADADGARILQLAETGAETPATWATRAAHISGGGTQLVRLSDGTATVRPDGSAVIEWDASWSVNFYGGLVPFTIADPLLTVDADGTGTLVADLTGYASSQENATEKVRLEGVYEDVVIATFRDVDVDVEGAVTISPDYAGVEVAVPESVSAQNRTVDGWGAWPQSFVDFQLDTGLSSYWYSSGGVADGKKAPTAFTVDLTGATALEPGGTDPGEEPGGTDPGEEPGETEPGEEPGGTEPGEEPGGTGPGEEPGGTDPGTTEPGGADPGATDPGATDPGTTEPGATDPGTTEPGVTEPGTTDPGTTEPGTTDPGTTDPGTTEPGATEPGATDPGAADPDPGAIEPAGTTGAPSFTPEPPAATGEGLPEALRDAIQVAVDGHTVTISGLEAEAWHFGYVYSTPVALGWFQASADGVGTTTLPESLEPGVHRIAVLDADGELVGWAEVTIADEAAPAGAGPLAATGSGVVAPGIAALTLLLAGLVLVLAQRRRARQEAAD